MRRLCANRFREDAATNCRDLIGRERLDEAVLQPCRNGAIRAGMRKEEVHGPLEHGTDGFGPARARVELQHEPEVVRARGHIRPIVVVAPAIGAPRP